MRYIPRSRLGTVFLGTLALLLAGCGGDNSPEVEGGAPPAKGDSAWQQIVATAKEQGRVTLYSGQTEQEVDALVDICQRQYPEIEIKAVRAPSGEIQARVERERASGADGADVWITSSLGWFLERAEEGALLKPSGPAVEEFPEDYLLEGTVVIPEIMPLVMAYNPTVIDEPIKSYEDLLREDLKGQLATTDIVATTPAGWYDWLRKTYGADFVEKFAAQEPKLFAGSTPATQAVASGELAATAYTVPTAVAPLIEQGAPLEMVTPEQMLGLPFGAVALGWSKRPEAALVLLDCIMSRQTQEQWHSWGLTASPYEDIEGELDNSGWTIFRAEDYPQEKINEITEWFNSLFKG